MDKKDVLAALMFYRNIDGEIRYYRSMVEELESYYDIDYYTAKIAELQTLKVEILREISGLEYKLKAIVTDYYLHGLKWEQVSARNHYSERQCKNIRDAAVGSLVKSFGANKIIAGFSFSK